MVVDDEGRFKSTVLEKILELETNDGRFETFCRGVISHFEGGAPILPTSQSWDLGRDGVGFGAAAGIYVCCSLRDDVDIKALTDLERIMSTTRGIARLYFCSSNYLSEHRRTQIEEQLQREADSKFPTTCLGSLQLAELARTTPKIVEVNYGPEINDCLRTIRADPDDDTEVRGLRLALMSSAADDSHAIRNEVYCSSLLDVIGDGHKRTATACAKEVSELLRLGRSLPATSVQPYLDALVEEGLIGLSGNLYSILPTGIERTKERELQAAERLLVGRKEIREALEVAIGSKLAEDHFGRIWGVFEERVTHYFLSRGDALVAEVSLLIGEAGSTAIAPATSLHMFLEQLSAAVAATCAHAQQAAELSQAVNDLFADRTSSATNWLVRVSASFIAACALGIEHSSGVALAKLMSRTSIVLDTDVALSLLGIGEPEHAAVHTIVTRWLENRGKVLIGEPVLEEIAYHAHIAQSDYDQVSNLIPGSAEDRLHFVENVFVRAFAELLAESKAKPRQWTAFIKQYRGSDARDWEPVLGVLSAEYSVGRLPPRSAAEEALEKDVKNFLVSQAERNSGGNASHNAKDKARRDAELYAALVHHVKSLRAVDPGATCLLVSSARRLTRAESTFHKSGEAQLVISIAAMLHLVSLLPNVSLGLSAMKAFLFDERRPGFSSDLERTLLRMVKASHEVSMPFAKRGTLMRSVRGQMIRDAEARGERRVNREAVEAMEREALSEKNERRTIEILSASLDEISADTRAEAENAKLRARVKELEVQLQRRSSRRS